MTEGDDDGRAVVVLLDEMLPWSEVRPGDAASLQLIEEQVRRAARFEPCAIKAGARLFVAARTSDPTGFDVAAMSKLYVLSRYYFDVPETAPKGRPRFASFAGVPEHDDTVNELWPWELAEEGEPRLVGYFRGYVGETYLALEELVFFKREYGVRTRPS